MLTFDKVFGLLFSSAAADNTFHNVEIKLAFALCFALDHVLFEFLRLNILSSPKSHIGEHRMLEVVVQFSETSARRNALIRFPCRVVVGFVLPFDLFGQWLARKMGQQVMGCSQGTRNPSSVHAVGPLYLVSKTYLAVRKIPPTNLLFRPMVKDLVDTWAGVFDNSSPVVGGCIILVIVQQVIIVLFLIVIRDLFGSPRGESDFARRRKEASSNLKLPLSLLLCGDVSPSTNVIGGLRIRVRRLQYGCGPMRRCRVWVRW